jgi:hypothetical protein
MVRPRLPAPRRREWFAQSLFRPVIARALIAAVYFSSINVLPACSSFETNYSVTEPPPVLQASTPISSVAACEDESIARPAGPWAALQKAVYSWAGFNTTPPVRAVFLSITNQNPDLWTVQSDQVFGLQRDDFGTPSRRRILPIPSKEAARRMPLRDLDAMEGSFRGGASLATYMGGLGALIGTIVGASTNALSTGVTTGAAIGGAAGAITGVGYEFLRLTSTPESKDVGDLNEKVTLLAFKDSAELYPHYTTSGYIYFPSGRTPSRTSDYPEFKRLEIVLVNSSDAEKRPRVCDCETTDLPSCQSGETASANLCTPSDDSCAKWLSISNPRQSP